MGKRAFAVCCIVMVCCGACQTEAVPENTATLPPASPAFTPEEPILTPTPIPSATQEPSLETVESALAVSDYDTGRLADASDSEDVPLLAHISGAMSDVLTFRYPDGTIYQEFQLGPYLMPRTITPVGFVDSEDISPTGEWAVIWHLPRYAGVDSYVDTQLSLINVWTGEVRTLPLFREDFPAGVEEAREREAVDAIEAARPQWSPDGRYLAYAAVLDGPSSDLYVYDVAADESTRLSFGSNQLFLIPGWSPDGEWIVHEEWLDVYTEDGIYDQRETIRAWAASLDGELVELFDPFDPVTGGNHAYPGWIGAHDLVVYDYLYDMGFRALRVDVSTGRTSPFLPQFGLADEQGLFYSLDVEPGSGLAAFGAYPQSVEDSPNLDPGLYLQAAGGEPVRVLDEDALRPEWLETLGMFYVQNTASAYLVDPEGVLPLEANPYGYPLPSPDGQWLLVYGQNGVQLYDATDGALVFWISEEDGEWAMWEPGSGGFVFGTGRPYGGSVWRVRLREPLVVEAVQVPTDADSTWPVLLVWESEP